MQLRYSRRQLAGALLASMCAGAAWSGAIGMASGLLPLTSSLSSRLPFRSPVFGGVALAIVVAAPMSAAAMLAWRRHPRVDDAVSLAGMALIGWIIIEVVVVRQFSVLQPICAALGLTLTLVGNRAIVRQVAEVVGAAPLFVTAPLLRPWHRRWGATAAEAAAPMPGDELVPISHLTATRAVTIDAPPEAVWPWLLQVGFGRAGFYSYDLLDNLARASVEQILPAWQHPHPGDLAAPMANPPKEQTSFTTARIRAPAELLWVKRDSSWSWTLRPLAGHRTRLVTRLRQQYRPTPSTVLIVILAEFGDFPMMRKMLLGIKRRAEATPVSITHPSPDRGTPIGVSP